MKTHLVYIIYSENVDKYYIGETSDIVNRLTYHNNGNFKRAYTKIANDWEVILSYKCNNRQDALYLEKFIKSIKSRKFIKRIIKTPEILSDILSKR